MIVVEGGHSLFYHSALQERSVFNAEVKHNRDDTTSRVARRLSPRFLEKIHHEIVFFKLSAVKTPVDHFLRVTREAVNGFVNPGDELSVGTEWASGASAI